MIIETACRSCGGTGVSGVVSYEMAADAGDPRLEGTQVFCFYCGGSGTVFEEVPDGQEN